MIDFGSGKDNYVSTSIWKDLADHIAIVHFDNYSDLEGEKWNI